MAKEKESEKDTKNIKCVLLGCDEKAVGFCNNCRMPICKYHGKKVESFYLCFNCIDFLRKSRLR